MESREIPALTGFGQIKEGDRLHVTFDGKRVKYKAKEVLNPGTIHEEIIVNKKRNYYFITSMALNGTSWAKDVRVEPGAAEQ